MCLPGRRLQDSAFAAPPELKQGSVSSLGAASLLLSTRPDLPQPFAMQSNRFGSRKIESRAGKDPLGGTSACKSDSFVCSCSGSTRTIAAN